MPLTHFSTDLQSPETYKKNFAETFAGRFTNCSLYPNWKCGKDGKGWMCGIAVVKAGMHHFASLAQTLCFFTKFPCNNKQNTPSQDTTWNWSSNFPLVSTGMFLSILFAHKQTSSGSKFHQNLWQHPIFLGCLLNWVAFINGFPPFFFMFISTSFIFLTSGCSSLITNTAGGTLDSMSKIWLERRNSEERKKKIIYYFLVGLWSHVPESIACTSRSMASTFTKGERKNCANLQIPERKRERERAINQWLKIHLTFVAEVKYNVQ